MRKNFAEVLKDAHIDIKEEYQKLYSMLFGPSIETKQKTIISMHDELGNVFHTFSFRGTCLTIDEFDRKFGFRFQMDPDNFSIDSLVSICEYLYNMLIAYQKGVDKRRFTGIINVRFCLSQVMVVIETIGYISVLETGFTIFVEKSPAAISVAETMPESTSYKVIEYNHYSMKGNLEEKRNILLLLSNILEPKRPQLGKIDSGFTSDLFYAFNNFNIRHNNANSDGKRYFSQVIANMSDTELEYWYDETYQMCLLAFLRLEQAKRKAKFDEIKNRIENGR